MCLYFSKSVCTFSKSARTFSIVPAHRDFSLKWRRIRPSGLGLCDMEKGNEKSLEVT